MLLAVFLSAMGTAGLIGLAIYHGVKAAWRAIFLKIMNEL